MYQKKWNCVCYMKIMKKISFTSVGTLPLTIKDQSNKTQTKNRVNWSIGLND